MYMITETFMPTHDNCIMATRGDLIRVEKLGTVWMWVMNLFSREIGFVPIEHIDNSDNPSLVFHKYWFNAQCRVLISQEKGNGHGPLVACTEDDLVIVAEAKMDRQGWVEVYNTRTGCSGSIQLCHLQINP